MLGDWFFVYDLCSAVTQQKRNSKDELRFHCEQQVVHRTVAEQIRSELPPELAA